MLRAWPLFAVALLLVAGLIAVPEAEGSHQWGHRFMIAGRILDADGHPAQMLEVTLSIESVHQLDPQLTVTTDCAGFYYSLTDNPGSADLHLDAAGSPFWRMHLHNFPGAREYRPDAHYIVATPYASYREDRLQPTQPLTRETLAQYAIHRAPADRDLQSAIANIRMDVALEPHEACEDHPGWAGQHIVVGKVQEIGNRVREETALTNLPVNVTIETAAGPRSTTVFTDVTAMYVAVFDNVSITPGSRVTAQFEDRTYRAQADTEYQLTRLNAIQREPIVGTGAWVFLGILGGGIVLGAAWWGGMKLKDRMEVEKARGRSTRKRANR